MATPDDDKDDCGESGGRWAPTHNRGEHLLKTEIGMHNGGNGRQNYIPLNGGCDSDGNGSVKRRRKG